MIRPKPEEVPMGKLLDELQTKYLYEGKKMWEEKLKLWLRPKPSYIPSKLWGKIVSLVLIQTVQHD